MLHNYFVDTSKLGILETDNHAFCRQNQKYTCGGDYGDGGDAGSGLW